MATEAIIKKFESLTSNLSPKTQASMYLKWFGTFQVPMIGYVKPQLIDFDSKQVRIKIPLTRRTKNHLNCLYFGVLAVGADMAGAFLALAKSKEAKAPVSIIFKDFKADFLKRAEGDTVFHSADGEAIGAAIDRAIEGGERQNLTVHVVATVPEKMGDEPVARFELTLSLKRRSQK